MKNRFSKYIALGSLLTIALISGCSTLEGVGKDMQNLGQGIGNSNSGNKQAPVEQPNSNGAVVTPIK